MKRIKRLASQSPITFGFAVTLAFILMVIISAVVANQWPAQSPGWYIGSTVSRVISIAFLLMVLSGLGWLRSAGFLRPGRLQTWLLLLLPLAYAIGVSAYAMTGDLNFRFSDPALTTLVALFILTAAFLEEVAFRGLILHAFVRVWGGTNRGLIKSVLVSSLFFAGMHIVNILGGQPLRDALLQSAVAFFLGVFLAALVLVGRSIYPAAFFHSSLNFAGYLNLTSNAAESSPSAWFLLSLLLVPMAIIGLYLLRRVRQNLLVLDAA